MPCRSGYDDVAIRYEVPPEVRRELNKITEFLCDAMSILDRLVANGRINGYSITSEHTEWWENHKKFDKKEGRR